MPRQPEPISDEAMRAAAGEIVLADRALRDQAVAAIARVRALHTRSEQPRVTRHVCPAHAYAHIPTASWHASVVACPDCIVTEKYVCTHCQHECPDDDTWPCPTMRAVEGEH